MDLVFYVLRLRVQILFKTLFEKWPMAIMNSFFIFFFGMYGVIFGQLLDKKGSGLLEIAIYSGIVSLTLIKSFFPVYKRMVRIIPSFYPVSRIKSIAIDIVKDFVSPFFLLFSVFIVAMTFTSVSFDYKKSLFSILLIIGSHLITRIIKTIIENKLNLGLTKMLWLVSMFMLVVSIFLKNPNLLHENFYNVLLIFSAILTTDLLLETSVNEYKKLNVRLYKIRLGIYEQLLFNNKRFVTVWLMAILIKIFTIVLDIISVSLYNKHGFPLEAMLWLFLSPVFLFTYIFNNIFGYYSNFWLTTNLIAGEFKSIFFSCLRILIIPFLLDFFIFLIYSFIIKDNIWINILIYCCFSFILTCLATLWSVLFPIYLGNKEFGLRISSNTSKVAAYITIAIIFSTALVKISVWFYLLYPAYILGGIYVIYYLNKEYKNKISSIFEILYRKY